MAQPPFTYRLWLATAGLVMAAALAVIVYFQSQYSIIADNAIFLEYAGRLAAGGDVLHDYFDPNFPQTPLLYLPSRWIAALTGMPLYYAFPAYVYAILALSVLLCWKLLRTMPFMPPHYASLCCSIFALGYCYASDIHLGQRDPLILLGLLPMILAQFCMNEGLKLPRALIFTALGFGTLMVLAKPHYGLMPTLMLLWPLLQSRCILAVMRRADFLFLAAGTIIMVAANLLLFPDYFAAVVPEVVALYAKLKGDLFTLRFALLQVYFLAALPAAFMLLEGPQRRLSLTLSATGLCLLLAYYVQYKGLYYHLIPALALAPVSLFILAAFHYVQRPAAGPATAITLTVLLMLLMPVKPAYPTHAQARILPIAKLLREECTKPCRFFMSNQFNFMAHESALYTGSFFASRFTSLWFDPSLSCSINNGTQNDETRARLERYGAMLAEDLERYKPSLLILYKGDYACEGAAPAPQGYPDIYLSVPGFRSAFSSYEKTRSINVNRRDYFRGTDADFDYMLEYDIYRRRDE